MKVVRGRADARWLPSRYSFALFRLYGFLRMRFARPQTAGVALIIDRNQSAAENFTVGAWILLTLAAYVAATLARWWTLPGALLAAIPVALLLINATVVIIGVLLIHRGNNLRMNSIVLITMMTGAAGHFAREQSWVRFAAWQFLAVLALNALAAVFVLLLRNAMAEAESTLGGFTSEL